MRCSSTKFCSWRAASLGFVQLGLWATAFEDEQLLSRYLQTLSESDCSMTPTLGWLSLVWGCTVSMSTLDFLLLSAELDISTEYWGSSATAKPQLHCWNRKGSIFFLQMLRICQGDSKDCLPQIKKTQTNNQTENHTSLAISTLSTSSTSTLTYSVYLSRYRKSISPK